MQLSCRAVCCGPKLQVDTKFGIHAIIVTQFTCVHMVPIVNALEIKHNSGGVCRILSQIQSKTQECTKSAEPVKVPRSQRLRKRYAINARSLALCAAPKASSRHKSLCDGMDKHYSSADSLTTTSCTAFKNLIRACNYSWSSVMSSKLSAELLPCSVLSS